MNIIFNIVFTAAGRRLGMLEVMNTPKKLSSLVMSMLTVMLFGAAFAQPEQHSYFVGTIGDDVVQVELIIDNGSVRGSFYDSAGTERTLEGGLGNRSELSVVVLGADEMQLATMTGVLEPTRFEGDYTPSGSETSLAVAWQTVADYAYLRFDQNMLESSTVFPYFTADASLLNADWQSRALGEHLEFVREGQDYMDEIAEGDFVTGYFRDARHDIVYYASDLVSVLETVSVYTGGAHPNFYYNAYNVGIAQDAVPFRLGDVLASGGVSFLSDYVIDELREQEGALYVRDGSIAAFDEQMLSVFVVSPAGLRIYFAPYAVGPYAAGAFEVMVPWGELEPYIPADSPLARFL